MSKMRSEVAEFLRARPACRLGRLCRLPRQPLSSSSAQNIWAARALAAHLRRHRRARGGQGVLRRAEARQAAGQYRRTPVALLPSRLDHASANDARGAAARRACAPRRCVSASASSTSTTSGRSRPGARRLPSQVATRSPRSSPVPLTIESSKPRTYGPDLGERRIRRGTIRDRGRRLRIGLVNNMPDAALQATERQFASLLEDFSGEYDVRLVLVTSRHPAARAWRARSDRRRLSRARRPARPAPRRDPRHRRRTARARTQRRAVLERA